MVNIVVDVSKYLLILLIAYYTFLNFRYFSVGEQKRRHRICAAQIRTMFVLHLLAYTTIYLNVGDEAIVVLYLAQVIFFLCYIYVSRLFYRNISRLLVNNLCMFLCIGFIVLTRISLNKALRQFVIVGLSAVITMGIPFIMERVWQLSKIRWLYGIGGILLLTAVLLMGETSFGAQLSLRIGGFSFQPAEFVKISFVFFVSSMFYRSAGFVSVALTTLTAAAHVLILALSKDLGGAFLFFVTYIFMVFAATSNWLYLAMGTGAGAGACALAYRLFSHVRVRTAAWLNPWADIDGKGYQIAQSLFAIGTGGWFGMGLCQGMPAKIPIVEKDFMFAAISEELGGVFAFCLVLLCLGCFWQFMMTASRMDAMFYKLIVLGLGTEYIVQVFLAVGGVTKFIPATGITLPFISYGGSSILGTFLLFQIIQGLYVLKENNEEEDGYQKAPERKG